MTVNLYSDAQTKKLIEAYKRETGITLDYEEVK